MLKNPHAVALGRKGGKKGGRARAKRLSAAERSDSARRAVLARWKRDMPKKTAKNRRRDDAFFANPSLEDLAREQDVRPIIDLETLGGVFAGDFDVEDFVNDIYEERRRP